MASVGSTTAIKTVRLKSGETRWTFQWVNWISVKQADGTVTREREQHTERKKTKLEAVTLKKAIIAAHSRGELFAPGSERPVARLRDATAAYVAASPNAQTRRVRMAWMNRLISVVGEKALVSDLSTEVLRAVQRDAADLGVVCRVVAEVELMWKWLSLQDGYPGVPPLRRISGSEELPRPEPVFATATPTLQDCDAMLAQLDGWHRDVGVILRYTGLRISQVFSLDMSDVNLDGGWLRLRANVRGAKKGRTRVVPMHPSLVEELRGWNLPARGFLIADHRAPGVLQKPFSRAWRASGVDEAKWGAPEDDAGGRQHERPSHAFRGALESHLIRKGHAEVAKLITGHSTSATHDAYIAGGNATDSPYWQQMLDAHAAVPPIDRGANVVTFSAGGRSPSR